MTYFFFYFEIRMKLSFGSFDFVFIDLLHHLFMLHDCNLGRFFRNMTLATWVSYKSE